jgi:UDP-N-acetylmuramyl pentapeptide phosphotransferase/UDP-N-acetylglucosamine-1-phosphate transferase
MEGLNLFAVLLAFLVSGLTPFVIIPFLLHREVVDVPNARSSHKHVAVRGVGLSSLIGILTGLGLLLSSASISSAGPLLTLAVSALLAAGVGFVEDVSGIRVKYRAALQILVGLLAALAVGLLFAQPWWLLLIIVIWIAGYINVANFMDGIDGLSGLHGAVVGCFFGFLGRAENLPWLSNSGWIVAVAFLAFLPWNLFRRGTFLGDVGSYLLGAVAAVMAALAVAAGVSVLVALSPLALYLFDTSTTLVKRVVKRERWFEAHRLHVYQKLTALGFSHIASAAVVAGGTVLTGVGGLLVAQDPALWPVLVADILVVGLAYLGLPLALSSVQGRNKRREVSTI